MLPWIRPRLMKAAAMHLAKMANTIGTNTEPEFFEMQFQDMKTGQKYSLEVRRKKHDRDR